MRKVKLVTERVTTDIEVVAYTNLPDGVYLATLIYGSSKRVIGISHGSVQASIDVSGRELSALNISEYVILRKIDEEDF